MRNKETDLWRQPDLALLGSLTEEGSFTATGLTVSHYIIYHRSGALTPVPGV